MGRRRNESILDIAIQSTWPFSAALAIAILVFGYVVLPIMTQGNPFLVAVVPALRPFVWLLAGVFGLIALVKWVVASQRARESTRVDPARRVQPKVGASVTARGRVPEPFDIPYEPTIKPTPTELAREWSLELIQSIEWKRFEDVCQKFYEAKGIRCACTPLGPDGGIDIRLFQDDSGKATAIVQCKAWGDSFVGVKPIRELLGVMVHEKVEKAFFMTSGKYSDEAKAFAEPNRIILIDGTMLLSMFKRLPQEESRKLFAFATEGDYNVPSCPTCGTKMRLITGREGKRDFWGCKNYPRCKQKLWARRGAVDLPVARYQ